MLSWAYEALQSFAFLCADLLIRGFPVSGKTRLFVEERRSSQWLKAVATARAAWLADGGAAKVVWIHISSAGELEQVRPLLKALAARGFKLFLTYFSPSARAFLGDLPGLLIATAFPLDLRARHRQVFAALPVKQVLLVRYDAWPGLLAAAKSAQVPVSLVAASSSGSGRGPRWWRRLKVSLITQPALRSLSRIVVVNEHDAAFFRSLALPAAIQVGGDAKWERAQERARLFAQAPRELPLKALVERLRALRVEMQRSLFVFGSPHADERQILCRLLRQSQGLRILLIPHEIDATSVEALCTQLQQVGAKPCLWKPLANLTGIADEASFWAPDKIENKVLIYNQVGDLAELYAAADLAIVGGGFDGQIHNVLEAAAHGIPVAFGSQVMRAPEAQTLLDAGAGLGFAKTEDLFEFLCQCATVSTSPGQVSDLSTWEEVLASTRRRAFRCFTDLPPLGERMASILFP